MERAYLEAFKSAQEMWSELLKQRRDPRLCFFEVRGMEGDLLFIFPLQEVVDSCTDRAAPALQRAFLNLVETQDYVRRVRDGLRENVRQSRQIRRDSQAPLRGDPH